MVDMRPYSIKVRRSLLQRDLMAGIPASGLLMLATAGIFFLYVLRMFFMIPVLIVAYFIMRYLTSRDPWMIDIMLTTIKEKDFFIP